KELALTVSKDQSKLAEHIDDVTTQMILDLSKQGDLLAQKAMDLWHQHVALGIITLAQALDPDSFIISGGMSKFVDYEKLKEMVADRSLPRISESLDIHESKLGVAAGIIGAAHIVLDQIIENKK